jgi:hypothetical protein
MSALTADEVAAIWTEINAVSCELEALSVPFAAAIVTERIPNELLGQWIRRDSAKRCTAIRDNEESREALRLKLRELHARLPPTGEASGQHLVIANTLGTCYVRESEPEYVGEVNVPVDEWAWCDPP